MSTAPAIDERKHAAAVIAAIKASLTALRADIGGNVFDFGSVPGADGNPGTIPETYVAVAVERRFVTPRRSVQLASRSGWRISVRHVARSVNNARFAALAVTNALDGQYLTVDGYESTAVLLENTTAIEPDSGWFSGLSSWTYSC